MCIPCVCGCGRVHTHMGCVCTHSQWKEAQPQRQHYRKRIYVYALEGSASRMAIENTCTDTHWKSFSFSDSIIEDIYKDTPNSN